MTRTNQANTPVETFRDGRLKATVWDNEGESGPYHTVSLAKTYEDRNGELRDTYSFSGGELLRVAELAREAHGYVRDLRREVAQERRAEAHPDSDGPSREERPRRFRGYGNSKPNMER